MAGFAIVWRSLWVPFEDDFGTLISSFHRHRELLDAEALAAHIAQSQIEQTNLQSRIYDCSQEIRFLREQHEAERRADRKSQSDARFLELLRWLAPARIEAKLEQYLRSRYSGTAAWICEDEVVRIPLADTSQPSIAWIHGRPG